MAVKLETLTSPASVDNLDQVVTFVDNNADRFGLDAQKKFGLQLAVEEAFVNVCHYAYEGGSGEVFLTCAAEGDALVLEISDNGSPFDILSLGAPDTSSDIMDRQIGGLGVHFIRTLSDGVSYRRENGRNILRMVFRRTSLTAIGQD